VNERFSQSHVLGQRAYTSPREVEMASDDLDTVLRSVRERIARHRGKGIGESNTKNVLIEPILRALGWDVEDLDEVRREFKANSASNPVDYAIYVVRDPRLFIEAKGLDENLNDPKWANQIMGYASVAGVPWIALTDGDEWRIYNSHAEMPVDQKLFRRVVVSSAEPRVAETLSLLSKDQLQDNQIQQLWRAEVIDRQVKTAVEGLFALDVPDDFVRLIRKRAEALSPGDIRASLGRANMTIEFPAVSLPPTIPQPAGKGVLSTPAQATAPRSGPLTSPSSDKTPWRHVTMDDLIASGAIKPPLDLETTYKGHLLTARIETDGSVTWDGTRYASLSLAGGMARKSVVGAPPGREYPQTNGWTFWRFRDTDGRLAFVDVLRQRHFVG
jgi:hypothetical protein